MTNLSQKKLADAIRILSIDAVQQANSGHPGAPMGMADMAQVLWGNFLQHNPTNPNWQNRDRFVLSNGHASMLLYSLLHLTGYDLSIDDLKNFRQLHSKAAGHPEYGYVAGIETTTGPLGQGITNAVGMAIAEKTLAAQFNRDNFDIVNHHTYVFLGDGCLMEGISHEACSLAGTLKLGKLIALYDDNNISIDGNVEGWFTDDTAKRFEAYGWHVIKDIDGHNATQITNAIQQAKAETNKPSIIICKTTIGYGSPNKAGTHNCHGAPLGNDEVALVRKELAWEYAAFEIPADIYAAWDAKEKGKLLEAVWQEKFTAYSKAYPELAAEFTRRIQQQLPTNWQTETTNFIQQLQANPAAIATRKSSQNAIEAYAKLLPEFLGGSADLAGSNLTLWSGSKPIIKHPDGNYINYGVREFAMCAIMNGITLYKGFIPYGGTFLMFMEYAHNAVRMAALMQQRVIYVFTHDSIGVGEDGPTHQPVEQTSSLRLIPNLNTWRPCDQVEAAVAWKLAVETTDKPTALILTRQNLAQMDRNQAQLDNIKRGAYILVDCDATPDLILIATGSEVELAVKAATELTTQGKKVRVVSIPCTELFDQQDASYRETVLPASVTKRIAIEAGITDFWYKYVGLNGKIIGMNGFGESGPAALLFKEFGFTVENVVAQALSL